MSDSQHNHRDIAVLRRAAALGYDPRRVALALGLTLRSGQLGASTSETPDQAAPDRSPGAAADSDRPNPARPSA